jgi:hypothetical protein
MGEVSVSKNRGLYRRAHVGRDFHQRSHHGLPAMPEGSAASDLCRRQGGHLLSGNRLPRRLHYDVKGNLWPQMAGLGGIVEIDPRGIIVGFVPIPNGDLLTINFAFGDLDNQYFYFEGATISKGQRAAPSGASRRPIPA